MSHDLASGMRKAAILVATLDQQTASRVLERFEPDQAQRLRHVVRELGPIDPGERQRVLEEFLQLEPRRSERSSAETPAAPRRTRRSPPRMPTDEVLFESQRADADDAAPFSFLQQAEAERLAKALANERPQTVALVLAHLSAEQAGTVLVNLDSTVQAEVVRRLIDLEETDPLVLREVERALEARLAQQVPIQRRRVAGMKAVAGILRSSARSVGTQILRNLAAQDRALAEKLGPQRIAFDDLLDAGDAAWGAIVDHADREILMLALLGAPQLMVERVTAQMTSSEGDALLAQLDNPGPIRLRDVEQARHEIAELARRLAFEGRLQLPGLSRRMAAELAA